MKVKMSNDDRCAVAVLLDQRVTPTDGWNPGGYEKSSDADFARALQAVEGLLRILDHDEVADPPDTLVASTLRRCREIAHTQPAHNFSPVENGRSYY